MRKKSLLASSRVSVSERSGEASSSADSQVQNVGVEKKDTLTELGLPRCRADLSWREAWDYVGRLLPSQLAKISVAQCRALLSRLPELPVKLLVTARIYGMMLENPKTAVGLLDKIQNREDGAVPSISKQERKVSIMIGLPDDGWRPTLDGEKGSSTHRPPKSLTPSKRLALARFRALELAMQEDDQSIRKAKRGKPGYLEVAVLDTTGEQRQDDTLQTGPPTQNEGGANSNDNEPVASP